MDKDLLEIQSQLEKTQVERNEIRAKNRCPNCGHHGMREMEFLKKTLVDFSGQLTTISGQLTTIGIPGNINYPNQQPGSGQSFPPRWYGTCNVGDQPVFAQPDFNQLTK